MPTELLEKPALAETYQDEETAQMASGLHGEIGAIVIGALAAYVYPRDLGRVFNSQTTFVVGGTPLKRFPDAAFVSYQNMPQEIDAEIPFSPDLAVEVISQTDEWSEVVRKAKEYLQAGSQLVWVIDPYEHSVFVFQPGKFTQMLHLDEELNGGLLLSDFRLNVKALFPKQRKGI